MEKYSKELIIDYINGNDIDDYELDELENDKIFMKKVIDFSGDEKMYNFCSDNLKKDYEFVKYIIFKFNNDTKFITSVADYFLDNTDNDYERTELSIIMSELTRKEREINHYNILCDSIYSDKRIQVELSKLKSKGEEFISELGMGFLLIYDLYSHSEIILNFYAKKMIEDIFKEYDINLEKMLHNQFNMPDDINKQRLNNYMLSFIEVYDSMLASYASSHLEVLLPFRENIIDVQKNWNRYNNRHERENYICMFEKIHEYMKEADSIFSEEHLKYYIGRKLGILEKIKRYDYINDELFEYFEKELSDEFVENTLKNSFIEMLHYNNVKKIIEDTLFGKNSDLTSNLIEDSKKTNKCKVLKFRINSNNKED